MCVDTITVRNVPPDVRQALKEKARRSGRSLQDVALEALQEKVQRKTAEEWLEEADEHVRRHGTRLGAQEIVTALHEERGDPDA
jgi:plasmid stability protein